MLARFLFWSMSDYALTVFEVAASLEQSRRAGCRAEQCRSVEDHRRESRVRLVRRMALKEASLVTPHRPRKTSTVA